MTREKRVANRKPKRKKPEALPKESGVDPIRDKDEIVSGDDCEVVGDEDCDGIGYADEEENNEDCDGIGYADEEENNEEVCEDEEEVREEENQNRVGVDEELCEERDFEAHFGAAARDEAILRTKEICKWKMSFLLFFLWLCFITIVVVYMIVGTAKGKKFVVQY